LAGWDPQIDLQGSKQTFLISGLAACKALSNVYRAQRTEPSAASRPSPVSDFSLSFSLSGTPAGRIVSRLSGGVIGGRCIGLNEKAK
jgi:hypothetical protein